MINGNWENIAEELAKQLSMEGSVTLSADEIVNKTGTTDRSARGRSFWLAAQRGDRFIDTFARAGITLVFNPNEIGQEVKIITFRPSHTTVTNDLRILF